MKYIIRHKKSIITGILLVLTLIAGWIWLNRKPETAAAGWWNDNWSYRKAIVINHAKVAGDLVNFPMLVSLTDTNLGSHAQADGDDIVFIVSNGEKLKHEIESFATTTGALVAWVKMPTLSSTADQTIYMYYGNGGVGNQEETSAVWDENYVGVWHMADATGASSSDSTSYGHNGTIHDSVTATSSGKIDGGLAFSPGTDRIAIGTSTVLDNLQYKTIEGWIKVTDQTGSGVILGKIDTDNTPGWSLSLHSSEQLRYIHSFFTSNGTEIIIMMRIF